MVTQLEVVSSKVSVHRRLEEFRLWQVKVNVESFTTLFDPFVQTLMLTQCCVEKG